MTGVYNTAKQSGGSRLCLGAMFLLLALLPACSSRVSTEDIRAELSSDSLNLLAEKMREAHEDHHELVTALNLARVYQLQGRWHDSIVAYDAGIAILEEYESRARISMRGLLGGAGSILISRGGSSYYGTGYERSLLHTLNAMNYLMLGDFTGAAVEMRRMEERQEMWLAEEEFRIQQYLEKKSAVNDSGDDLSRVPSGYSMAQILNDPEVRALAVSYQDPFSYALSAVINRLAGNEDYALVSLRRAAMLNGETREMFTRAWKLDQAGGAQNAEAADWHPRIPPLRGNLRKPFAGNSGAFPPDEIFNHHGVGSDRTAGGGKTAGTQEVTVIFTSGLAPALRMEQIRVPAPFIGYVLVDLPSYIPAVHTGPPRVESTSGGQLTPVRLLRAELLAYRFLRDEVRYEIGTAVSRALARAAVSGAAYAVARSNDDTRHYAPLIGLLTSVIMDAFATGTSQNVRNWETLPADGYLAMGYINRGDSLLVRLGGRETAIAPPLEARGVIIMISQTTTSTMRVDYVAY